MGSIPSSGTILRFAQSGAGIGHQALGRRRRAARPWGSIPSSTILRFAQPGAGIGHQALGRRRRAARPSGSIPSSTILRFAQPGAVIGPQALGRRRRSGSAIGLDSSSTILRFAQSGAVLGPQALGVWVNWRTRRARRSDTAGQLQHREHEELTQPGRFTAVNAACSPGCTTMSTDRQNRVLCARRRCGPGATSRVAVCPWCRIARRSPSTSHIDLAKPHVVGRGSRDADG